MGPLATAVFQRLIVLNTKAARDQDHLHVLVDSDPAIPDRTAFLVGDGPDPRPAIVAAARRLAGAGAELLVMPCNTANVFAEEVEEAVGVSLVPWFETAVDAVTSVGQSRPAKCGLLATNGTLRAGVFARVLHDHGIESLQPRPEDQRHVMSAIYGPHGIKATGRATEAARQDLLAGAESLAAQGANVLLLACTELPILVPADDSAWPIQAVDPAVEVARRTIRLAGGEIVDAPVAV
jgi:aspartate racemase